LAFPRLNSSKNPSKEGVVLLAKSQESRSNSESALNLEASENFSEEGKIEYTQLQLRIFRMTLIFTAFAVIAIGILIDFQAAMSLLVGALAGILYLRLLARGIGKLGKDSMSPSKIQLLVPVVLVISASRFSQLELLPALLGFLLYKISLIVQFLLEP